jgi:small-conductance mechanosensitive channel
MSAMVAEEIGALQQHLAFPKVLFFPAVAGMAWLLSRAVAALARFAIRLGVRRRRLLVTGAAFASVGLWAWALVLILGRLLRSAPTLTLMGVVLAAVVLLVGLFKHVENIASGLGLAVRSRMEEGDQVRIGPYLGMVERVGLMRVQLRASGGDTVYVPNRQFAAEAMTIGRARNSFPLRISLVRPQGWRADDIERARRTALLSPYRDPKGRVAVQAEGDDGSILVVEIQIWLERLLPAAEQHLRRMLDRDVAGR